MRNRHNTFDCLTLVSLWSPLPAGLARHADSLLACRSRSWALSVIFSPLWFPSIRFPFLVVPGDGLWWRRHCVVGRAWNGTSRKDDSEGGALKMENCPGVVGLPLVLSAVFCRQAFIPGHQARSTSNCSSRNRYFGVLSCVQRTYA